MRADAFVGLSSGHTQAKVHSTASFPVAAHRISAVVFRSIDSGRDLHQYHSQSQNQFHWDGNGIVRTECSRSSSGKPQHCASNCVTYLRSFEGKKIQSQNLLIYVSYCSVATQTMMTSGRPFSAWIYRYSDFASEGWSVCGQYLASILSGAHESVLNRRSRLGLLG